MTPHVVRRLITFASTRRIVGKRGANLGMRA
jgi:hypothetical protein